MGRSGVFPQPVRSITVQGKHQLFHAYGAGFLNPMTQKAPKLASKSVSEIHNYSCPAMRGDEATSLGIRCADKRSQQIDLLDLDSPASS